MSAPNAATPTGAFQNQQHQHPKQKEDANKNGTRQDPSYVFVNLFLVIGMAVKECRNVRRATAANGKVVRSRHGTGGGETQRTRIQARIVHIRIHGTIVLHVVSMMDLDMDDLFGVCYVFLCVFGLRIERNRTTRRLHEVPVSRSYASCRTTDRRAREKIAIDSSNRESKIYSTIYFMYGRSMSPINTESLSSFSLNSVQHSLSDITIKVNSNGGIFKYGTIALLIT
eukprot:scaffold17366_cov182-Amphora_coffeaeformis.AAC.6